MMTNTMRELTADELNVVGGGRAGSPPPPPVPPAPPVDMGSAVHPWPLDAPFTPGGGQPARHQPLQD